MRYPYHDRESVCLFAESDRHGAANAKEQRRSSILVGCYDKRMLLLEEASSIRVAVVGRQDVL